MEEKIAVTFSLQNSTNVGVEAPRHMIVKDALEQLLEMKILAMDTNGLSKAWQVRNRDDNSFLDITRTFAQNGITDGAELSVYLQCYRE